MKKELQNQIFDVINEMTQLEVEMARQSYSKLGFGGYTNDTQRTVAEWVNKLSSLSSRLDKIVKGK